MASRKRGAHGRFKAKKGKKGKGSVKLLTSMKKQLTRIENKIGTAHAKHMRGKKHARLTEAELAAKYG